MKLAIYTQYRENYGAHDWDGKGACPQYWKSKGGSTYVVAELTPAQVLKIKDSGIPVLKGLIEFARDTATETVIDWAILDDSVDVCEPWEAPIMLDYNPLGREWHALEVHKNDEYHSMREPVERSISTWKLGPQGEIRDHTVTYVMRNGDIVNGSDVGEYLRACVM